MLEGESPVDDDVDLRSAGFDGPTDFFNPSLQRVLAAGKPRGHGGDGHQVIGLVPLQGLEGIWNS